MGAVASGAAGAGDRHLTRRYLVLDTLSVCQRRRLVTETADRPGHVGCVAVAIHSTTGRLDGG